MARPEHLHCPNTAEGIRRINEMQDAYDENPTQWERQEQEAREQYQMEQEEMRIQEQQQYERWQEQQQDNLDDLYQKYLDDLYAQEYETFKPKKR